MKWFTISDLIGLSVTVIAGIVFTFLLALAMFILYEGAMLIGAILNWLPK